MQNIPYKVINYKTIKIRVLNFFSKQKRILVPLLFIVSYLLFYFLIDFSTQSLVAHDEGLYARRARLLEDSYNWFSSPFDSPHHKTLGSYWLIAFSIRIFGYSELALRLPSIIVSFFCLFITYFIALKLTNKKSALLSVFALSSMPLWIQYSRYASPDVLFVSFILLVILFFLNFLDSNKYWIKCIYVFFSGFFISFAFFIRSYMVFVPLIGLTPFLIFNLFNTRNSYKAFFSFGLLVGSIPTIFNLYFAYKSFGIKGITALFDFAKKQAINGFDFRNTLIIPLNYLYFTFPVGILFILFLFFKKTRNNRNYSLLIYIYPFISFSILLCMSTSYPHYYLFLLPSLSILFSEYFQSNIFRYSFSKKIINSFLLFFMVFLSLTLLTLLIFFNELIIHYANGNSLLVYIVTILLLASCISSIRFLVFTRTHDSNLLKFFYNIIIPQYISFSLFFNFGVLGSPNIKTKIFLNDIVVSSIVKSNTVYLFNVDSKIQTLLSYYLPSSKNIDTIEEINMYNYVITSDRAILNNVNGVDSGFKLIKEFDSHLLLMNISK